MPPSYNGALGQEQWVIRQNPRRVSGRWMGLVGPHPALGQDSDRRRKPINAKAETVATLPTFCDAYKRRRCRVPIDNFFEWKAIKASHN